MTVTGQMLIGQRARFGANGRIHGLAAASGELLQPAFGGAEQADLEHACALAQAAFEPYRQLPLEQRAAFLESIASHILELGDELIERCQLETGLPRARLEGERGRTVGQLRLFAAVVRNGGFLGVRIDRRNLCASPCPGSTCACGRSAWGRWRCSARRTFPWPFPWPVAIPPRPWQRAAR